MTACTASRRTYDDQEGSASSGGAAPTGGADSAGDGGTTSTAGQGGRGGGQDTGGQGTGGQGTGGQGTGGQDTGSGGTSVEPESCAKDDDCPSGSCRLSYRDRDGDGYGVDNDVTGRCDGTIPAGYTPFGGDCCDDGGNVELAALIHPGQTEYFDSPANICGISWDYDCNEIADPSPHEIPTGGCAVPDGPPPCSYASYIAMTEDDCGKSRGLTICQESSGTCKSGPGATAKISCR